MKVGSYSHLPLKDQLSFIRLLVFCEGLRTKYGFDERVAAILGVKIE